MILLCDFTLILILILITVNNWNTDSAHVGDPASPEVRPRQPQREFCSEKESEWRIRKGSVKLNLHLKIRGLPQTPASAHHQMYIYLIIFFNHLTLWQPGDYWLWGYSGRHLGLWQDGNYHSAGVYRTEPLFMECHTSNDSLDHLAY